VVEEMLEICDSLRAAEVTVSVRDARIGGREVPEGAYIGFLGGELIAVEETLLEAALVLARKIVGEGVDFLTLLKGEDLSDDDLAAMLEEILDLDKDLEVEVRDGGQPLYPVQMVAE
jgi:dihydroxyacetone kinase-like predicted kinase